MNYHMLQQLKSRIKGKLVLNFTYTKHGTTNNDIKLNQLKLTYYTFHNTINNLF